MTSPPFAESEKVSNQLVAARRAVRLGMKLNPEDRTRAMRHCHHDALARFSIDVEVIRHRLPIDHERVISRRSHRGLASSEQSLAAMHHLGHFAEIGRASCRE